CKGSHGLLGDKFESVEFTKSFKRQTAEFDALDKLVEAYRQLTLIAVVDDDYPEVRHKYESTLRTFLKVTTVNE
ncbi:hypothetical protein LCGC14_2422050, partial [marine sediment metagenome]